MLENIKGHLLHKLGGGLGKCFFQNKLVICEILEFFNEVSFSYFIELFQWVGKTNE